MEEKKTAGIGQRIQKYRIENKLSASALSSKMKKMFGPGVPSRQFISKIENGLKQDITVTELLQFAQALGISPLALICDVEQPYKEADNPAIAGALNNQIYDWFNISEFGSTSFSGPHIDLPLSAPAERIRMIHYYLKELYDARSKSKDAYKLYTQAIQKKDETSQSKASDLLGNSSIQADRAKSIIKLLKNEYKVYLPIDED